MLFYQKISSEKVTHFIFCRLFFLDVGALNKKSAADLSFLDTLVGFSITSNSMEEESTEGGGGGDVEAPPAEETPAVVAAGEKGEGSGASASDLDVSVSSIDYASSSAEASAEPPEVPLCQ